MKDFVTYEQALALSKLGFKEECFYHYDWDNQYVTMPNNDITHLATSVDDFKISYNSTGLYDGLCYDAPTLAQAQKWLREKGCDIEISVRYEANTRMYEGWALHTKGNNSFIQKDLKLSTSYEEVLSAGITECLKLLNGE